MSSFLLGITRAGLNAVQNFEEAKALELSSGMEAQLRTENIKEVNKKINRLTAIRKFERKTEAITYQRIRGNARAQFAASGLKGGEEVIQDLTNQASLQSLKNDLEFGEQVIALQAQIRKEELRRRNALRIGRVQSKTLKRSSIIEGISFFA